MSTEADKVNTGALATLVAVGTFAMIGIAAAVTALVRYDVDQAAEEKRKGSDNPVQELKSLQTHKLHAAPAWIDGKKGTVSLPIDRAMEVVVADLQRDPNAATAVPPDKDAGVDAAVEASTAETADGGADDAASSATPDSAKPLEHAPDQGRKGPESITGELKNDKKPVPVTGGGITPTKSDEKPASPAPQPSPAPAAPAPAPNGQ
jgi:hypothetical protein